MYIPAGGGGMGSQMLSPGENAEPVQNLNFHFLDHVPRKKREQKVLGKKRLSPSALNRQNKRASQGTPRGTSPLRTNPYEFSSDDAMEAHRDGAASPTRNNAYQFSSDDQDSDQGVREWAGVDSNPPPPVPGMCLGCYIRHTLLYSLQCLNSCCM